MGTVVVFAICCSVCWVILCALLELYRELCRGLEQLRREVVGLATVSAVSVEKTAFVVVGVPARALYQLWQAHRAKKAELKRRLQAVSQMRIADEQERQQKIASARLDRQERRDLEREKLQESEQWMAHVRASIERLKLWIDTFEEFDPDTRDALKMALDRKLLRVIKEQLGV